MEVHTFSPRAKVEVGPVKRLFLKRKERKKDLRRQARRGSMGGAGERNRKGWLVANSSQIIFLPDHTFKKYFLC